MKTTLYLLLLLSIGLSLSSGAHSFPITVTPRLSVGEEYTDNVLLSDENPEEDYITDVTPGISIGMLGQKAGLDLRYDATYAHYRELDQYTTWRHQVDLSSWAQITRNSRLELKDYFLHTEDPVTVQDIAVVRTTEPNFPIDTTERTGRNPYSENVANLNFSYQFGRYDFFRLRYFDDLLINDAPEIEDSSTHEPSAGLTYWFLPTWGLDLDAAYTLGERDNARDITRWQGSVGLLKRFSRTLAGHLRYSHSVVEYEGERGRDAVYNPSIGFEYFAARDVSLYLDIGYYVNDFKARPDQSGPAGEARLIKLYKRGSLNLSVLGGYNYALFTTAERNGFEKFTEAAVSGTYFLSRHVSGTLHGDYRYSDYVDLGRQDDFARLGLDLNWMALSWLTVDLTYSHQLLDSSAPLSDYDENRAYLGISVFPPRSVENKMTLEKPINPYFPTGNTAP